MEPPFLGRVAAPAPRRILAFVLDSALLAAAGEALGLSFFDFFVRIGSWARLVGFAIATGYYAALSSRIGSGQTAGMRILGMAVVDRDGRPLSFARALVRTLVLVSPYFLSGALYLQPLSFPSFGARYGAACLGALLCLWEVALVYLLCFNGRTRQSLHDLAAGSFVVQAGGSGRISRPPFWTGHAWILGGIGAGLILCTSGAAWIAEHAAESRLYDAERAVESIDQVRHATVAEGHSLTLGIADAESIDFCRIVAYWRVKPADFQQAAYQVAHVALAADPSILNRDVLSVTVIYGFDLGIASGSVRSEFSQPPGLWQSGHRGLLAGRLGPCVRLGPGKARRRLHPRYA